MKKTLAVAKNLLLRLFRGKTGLGLILMASVLSVFIFFFAKSDGEILNELHIRIRYSLYVLAGFLNISLMYLACVSLRKDIDNRHFHTISAAPVHRAQIWLGKFFGLLIFGLITFFVSSAVLGIACSILIYNNNDPKAKELLSEKFYRTYYRCEPEREYLADLVDREYRDMKLKGTLPKNTSEGEIRKKLFEEIKKKEQMIKPGASMEWRFKWNPGQAKGEYVILKTKFYAEKKRELIKGNWVLSASGASGLWESAFSGYPYKFHELKIPIKDIPDADILKLTFKGENTPYLIFPRSMGASLYYDSGGLFKNYILLSVFIALNFSVLIALALTLASFFSYSVAVFVTIVIYSIGISSDFFNSVIRDLSFKSDEPFAVVASALIRFGVWLTDGVNIPPVIELFSEGVSIPGSSLAVTWGIGFLFYLSVLILIGIIVLTKKEIDKILQA